MNARRRAGLIAVATAATLIFTAASAYAALLVNQIPRGPRLVGGVPSYDASFSGDDNRAADDFTVPKGQVFTVDAVHATGFVEEGSGAATVDVIIYADDKGRPGEIITSTPEIPGGSCTTGDTCIFEPRLEPPVRLEPGNYWVSIQESGFVWRWLVTPPGPPLGAAAVWENPGGGLEVGCTEWSPIVDCRWTSAEQGTDLWYQLLGELADSKFSLGRFSRTGGQVTVAGSFGSSGQLRVTGDGIQDTSKQILAGNREVDLELTSGVKRRLARGDRAQIRVKAVYTAKGGVPYKQRARVTLKP